MDENIGDAMGFSVEAAADERLGEQISEPTGEPTGEPSGEPTGEATGEADGDGGWTPEAQTLAVVEMAAIKDRMHARRLSDAEDPGHVDVVVGDGDDAVRVIDDGPEHCMIGRTVGGVSDGTFYVLVGRISYYGYEQLRDGDTEAVDAFADGRDLSLCAVFAPGAVVQNIALVRHFRRADKIPGEYLPGSPFLQFADSEDSPDDGE
jgi:hypothetical protein